MNPSNATVPFNPYVGPRTFTEAEGRYFFGREREARDLTARIVSERLLLFYAQSGAGKSSLLNARVIPRLRDEEHFQVLPVGRVSGELPEGVAQVENIFAFNLMTSLDQSGEHPRRLARVTLGDFLAGLARETTANPEGERLVRWAYRPELVTAQTATPAAAAARGPRFALIVDQFEEIVTGHPGRWQEREGFFRQLNQALLADPNLWVVLTLREDYVASLDPYAELLFNRLRARFYMERMGVDAGLDAVRRPADLGGRPFAPGVAEQLVDNLRQVRVPGQAATVPGQYVEPVQLQVVCYQLWENLAAPSLLMLPGKGAGGEGEITFEDLAAAGDVDRALTQFYEETLATALADPAAAGVSERQVRAWFDAELITEAGTRGLVHQGEVETGGLPNAVVRALQNRFLVRGEARGGNTWIELVHDRFVEPIRANNAVWFAGNLSALQRQAALWVEQGRPAGLLLRDAALADAEAWAASHPAEAGEAEQQFLESCRLARQSLERERRDSQRIRVLAMIAGIVAVGALWIAFLALQYYNDAQRQTRLAQAGKLAAQAKIAIEEQAADPDLGILLARRAVTTTLRDGYIDSQASDELMNAMGKASPWALFSASQTGPLLAAEFSPVGNRLATVDQDQGFHLWDTQTGKEVESAAGVLAPSGCCMFFSDNGAFVAIIGSSSLQILDAMTGEKLIKIISDDFDAYDGEFSSDGTRLVTFGTDNLATLWDLQTGEPLPLPAVETQEAFFSPDSERLLLPDLSTWSLRLFDSETGDEIPLENAEDASSDAIEFGGNLLMFPNSESYQLRESRTGQALHPFGGEVMLQQAAFSPDGQMLAVVSEDGQAQILSAATGQVLRELQYPNIGHVWFSNTGKYLILRSNTGEGWLLHADSLQEIAALGRIQIGSQTESLGEVWTPISNTGFDTDDERFLYITEEGTATLFHIVSKRHEAVNGGTDYAWISKDGSRILTHTVGDWVQVYDSRSNKLLFEQSTVPYSLSLRISADGRYLQYENRIWSIETGMEMFPNTKLEDLQFSANGRLAKDGTRVWDTTTARSHLQFGTAGKYNNVLFIKDSDRIMTVDASSSWAGAGAGVWDGTTGQQLFSPGQADLWYDSRKATAADPVVRVRQAGDAKWGILWNILTGETTDISPYLSSVNFDENLTIVSPNGRYVVVTGTDGTARVWDVSRQRERSALPSVGFVRISPDSRLIGVITRDGTVRLIDSDSGKDISLLDAIPSGSEIRFSDDSRLLFVREADTDECSIFDLTAQRRLFKVPATCIVESFSLAGGYLLTAYWSQNSETMQYDLIDLESREVVFDDGKWGRLMAVSNDGILVVFHDVQAQELVIVNTKTGRKVESVPVVGNISDAYLSPGNRFVAFSDDRGGRIWGISEHQQLWQLEKERFYSLPGPFSPDGQYVLTIAENGRDFRIRPSDPQRLLALSDGLIQRHAHELTPDEQQRYGLD